MCVCVCVCVCVCARGIRGSRDLSALFNDSDFFLSRAKVSIEMCNVIIRAEPHMGQLERGEGSLTKTQICQIASRSHYYSEKNKLQMNSKFGVIHLTFNVSNLCFNFYHTKAPTVFDTYNTPMACLTKNVLQSLKI